MAPRHQSTTGWILARSLSENDLRLTILSPNLGKIYSTAKGAQKITSSRLGILQPGNEVKIQLYSKNDFYWVTESKTIYQFLCRPKTLTQINLLFYFLEITNALIPQANPDPVSYQLVSKLIKAIDTDNFHLLILSEIKLVEHLGFGPPPEIIRLLDQKDLRSCQQALNNYLQSIIERPLFSPNIFK